MRRLPPFIVLGILLVACIALAWWQRGARKSGRVSLPETVAFGVLRPVQRAFSGVGGWFGDVGRTMFGRGGITRENRALQNRVADLDGRNQRLLRYRSENEELRALLKMPKPRGGDFVAAEIVSFNFSDFSQRLFLNVNARQGVRPKDVVFTSRGVVGQVVAANGGYPPSCEVLLLTDRLSSIGAMTARTAAKGVVQGTGENICKMSYLDYGADVREGDVVLTAGDSTIFPRGLVIGRVLKVEKDKTYSRTSAWIEPAVPLDRIAAAYVRVKAGP